MDRQLSGLGQAQRVWPLCACLVVFGVGCGRWLGPLSPRGWGGEDQEPSRRAGAETPKGDRAKAERLYAKGVQATAEEDLDAALECYSQAIQADPQCGKAYVNRAELWLRSGALNRAVLDCNIALHIDKNDSQAYLNRGAVALARGEWGRALSDTKKALKHDPNSSAAHVNCATAYAKMGRLDEALGHLDKAVRLEPGNLVAHENRAEVYRQKGWVKQADAEDKFVRNARTQPSRRP